MASEHSILCPLCGNKVPPGLTRCPVCATELQRVIAKRNGESRKTADFLRRDIPRTGLPKSKPLCPQCGLDLAGGESKCPRCGVPLSTEEATIECPECGALSAKDAKSCSRCGLHLQQKPSRAPAIAPQRGVIVQQGPTPAPATVPLGTGTQVRTESEVIIEKVTAHPATMPRPGTTRPMEEPPAGAQARPPDQGFVNGRGAVNGTGLVNGTGMTNGTRMDSDTYQAPAKPRRVVTRWQFLALLIAVIVIIPTFMYLSYPSSSGPITVDGKFEDWSTIAKFGMDQNSADSATNVTGWAVETDSAGDLYLYIQTSSSMMNTATIDSFYAFIDSDGSQDSGYSVSGMGADYMIEVGGWNGSVMTSVLTKYLAFNGDQSDWSGWEDEGSAPARLSGNQLELTASMMGLTAGARYMLISKSGETAQGVSHVIREDTPILIVRQEPSAPIKATGVIAKSQSTPAMHVILSCQGGSGTVSSLQPQVSGATGTIAQAGILELSPGISRDLTLNVNSLSSATGSVISVSIAEAGISASFTSIAITGESLKTYVGSAPASIQIDGAFGDWVGRTSPDTDPTEVKDDNIDISAVGAVNTTVSSSFYIGVEGEICGGSFVPSSMTKPSGSGGGTVIPAKKTGEDILRVYVDSDMSASTGSVVIHQSKIIGADYKIEITGLNGVIVSKSLLRFASGNWNYVPGTVSAAHDAQQIEIGIGSSSIDNAAAIDFVIETTDWRGWSDLATSVPQGTRNSGVDYGTRAWVIDDTIASSDSTATSNQRKLFFDGTNFWGLYVDGTDTVARYSTDGISWTSIGAVFKMAGVVRASIWYDFSNELVYAVGDSAAASANVYLQRGVVSPSAHAITWSVADRVLPVSSFTMGTKNAFISKDASGYLWVMSTNRTTFFPNYDLSVFKSAAPDSVAGSWTLTGSMLLNSPLTTAKGVVLPTGAGSDVWAVYGYEGSVASRKYVGTWSAESILYTRSAQGENTEAAPPSALVDANGVLHIVYGDDHERPSGTSKPHIWYRYNAGSGWSAALALSSTSNNNGFMYPTISLDRSTGNVYAFWYDMQSHAVVAMINVSGTWSSVTLNPQTGDVKQHLTSIYYAPSQYSICYEWTQNATAPIHVVFDRIPEFSDIGLPALGIVAVLVLVIAPTRRKPEQS